MLYSLSCNIPVLFIQSPRGDQTPQPVRSASSCLSSPQSSRLLKAISLASLNKGGRYRNSPPTKKGCRTFSVPWLNERKGADTTVASIVTPCVFLCIKVSCTFVFSHFLEQLPQLPQVKVSYHFAASA